jgi:protein-S-isoprenylcysteine O-methyltransferase Ste14
MHWLHWHYWPLVRSILCNVIVAAFLCLFVATNLKAYFATQNIGYGLVAFNESLYVLFYIVRRRAVASSLSPLDWGTAFSATFIGTLLRPAAPLYLTFGTILIAIGTILNIISVSYLNRSLGTVPAERTIKTHGIYRFIRHPMYSSDIISLIGYFLANLSFANFGIVVCNTILQIVRLNREELFLSRNSTYKKYTDTTKWHLLPFIY